MKLSGLFYYFFLFLFSSLRLALLDKIMSLIQCGVKELRATLPEVIHFSGF